MFRLNPKRLARLTAVIVVCSAGAYYLYDPPWVAGTTSGMRDWEEDPPGTRFRWTTGRSSFFIPANASEMTLPLRPLLPLTDGKPVVVAISVDDRWLTDVVLTDAAAWARPTLPLPRPTSRRSYRRVELRVSRVVGFYNLGVQVGEPVFGRRDQ
jgi:hypothetical protein